MDKDYLSLDKQFGGNFFIYLIMVGVTLWAVFNLLAKTLHGYPIEVEVDVVTVDQEVYDIESDILELKKHIKELKIKHEKLEVEASKRDAKLDLILIKFK